MGFIAFRVSVRKWSSIGPPLSKLGGYETNSYEPASMTTERQGRLLVFNYPHSNVVRDAITFALRLEERCGFSWYVYYCLLLLGRETK